MIPIEIPSPKLASSCLSLPVVASHTNKQAREITGLFVSIASYCWRLPDVESFPLDGRRRLARDVVDHAVDAAHLVDDAV
jgi:hypothetical protein